jgi:hypothetical protein
MHGLCFDYELQDWFDFKIPQTTIAPDFIYDALRDEKNFQIKPSAKVIWLGGNPSVELITKSKKGKTWQMAMLTLHDKRESFTVSFDIAEGKWFASILKNISVAAPKIYTLGELKTDYEQQFENFELFWHSKSVNTLRDHGLLIL